MFRLVSRLGLVFWLAGCGAGGSGTPGDSIDPSVLAGAWILPCQNFGGKFLSEELRFVGAQMSRSISNYADSGCDIVTHLITVDNAVEIPAMSEFMPNAYDVNLTVLGSEAAAMDAMVADRFSNISQCGVDSWPIGEVVDLSSADPGCYEGDYPPATGAVTFTLMRPLGKQLEIGQNSSFNDGKSEERRHINLADRIYTK